MFLGEIWLFLLGDSYKGILFECISDCLDTDRLGQGSVNVLSDLYSIFSFASVDFYADCPLVCLWVKVWEGALLEDFPY